MSEQALKDAQLAQALKQNGELMVSSRNMSAQLMSQKQCIDEYINANLHLRAVNLLFEEDVKNLKNALIQHAERIAVLEKENAEFKSSLELAMSPEAV